MCFLLFPDLMYITQTLGSVCLSAGVPLLFELSCEVTYPVAEGITAGIVTWLSNLAGLIFLFIMMIPNIGKFFNLENLYWFSRKKY